MNLQALYDLKERLEHAAIAGTSLLQEDFRLRRAVEALAPLAKASPVFAKISAGAVALLNAPETDRSTKLLDVLSLVDAVVYTQGTTNISGEMIPPEQGTGRYVQASYGQLQPLLAALSGTGSGRTSLIRECWIQHPDYFTDFRVLPSVVGALGDNYVELADLIAEILMKQGASVIPLLKDHFDPAGKTEMVRRVRQIGWMGGEAENDWLLSILPEGGKEVREAVIQLLGLSQSNTQVLLDLCMSERGKLRDAALRSLAMMENPQAVAFWESEVSKHPGSVMVLSGVDTKLAAGLCTVALRNYLQKLLDHGKSFSGSELEQLHKLTAAFCGKYSSEVLDFWLWVGEHMDALDKLLPDELVFGCDCSAAELMQRCLLLALLRNPCYGMLRLAHKLSSLDRRWFLCCGLMADLLDIDCSPEQTYETYSPCIKQHGLFSKETEEQKGERIQIMRAFAPLSYDPENRLFRMTYSGINALGNERECVRHLRRFDSRWAILLANHEVPQDGTVYDMKHFRGTRKVQTRMEYILMNLIPPECEEVCKVCGEYLYKRVKITGSFPDYREALVRCGWKDWNGLLAHCVLKENQVIYHRMLSNLAEIPMSNREKAEELRQIHQFVISGRVSVWNGIWPVEQVEHLITRLESLDTAQIL